MVGKAIHFVRDIAYELLCEKTPGLKPRFEARRLTKPREIRAARALSTKRFVELGKITPDQVDDEGILLTDTYLPVSTFFGVFRKGRLVAAVRLLGGGAATASDIRIPIDKLDPEYYVRLRDQPAGEVAEIGALAKVPGTSTVAILSLYRQMFRYAHQAGITTLVCAIEPKLVPRYNQLFGGALKPIGSVMENRGIVGPQIPLLLDLHESLDNHRAHYKGSRNKASERAIAALVRAYIGDFTTE